MSTPTDLAISPERTPYLYEQREAVALLQRVRWRSSFYCPRCGSTDVREVQTDRILEAFSCRACQYNFTTLADSYFHGSRIPVFEQLRFLAALQLEPDSSAGRLARFFNWKTTTVTRQMAKLPKPAPIAFVRALENYQAFESFSTVTDYFEQPGLRLRPDQLERSLDQLFEKSGRVLRRAIRAKTDVPAIPSRSPIPISKMTAGNENWLRPAAIPQLLDDQLARELIDARLWREGQQRCPRCYSTDVTPVKSNNYRKFYRCKACANAFSPAAQSIFRRTKLPANKILQFFALYSALGSDLTVQELCFAIGCTVKTATHWLRHAQDIGATHTFAAANQSLQTAVPGAGSYDEDNASFLTLCEMKRIVVDTERFDRFVTELTQL